MALLKLTLGSALILTSLSSLAAADELLCEPGQKKVSFADGNSSAEVCVENAQMEATVPNPEIQNSSGHD